MCDFNRFIVYSVILVFSIFFISACEQRATRPLIDPQENSASSQIIESSGSAFGEEILAERPKRFDLCAKGKNVFVPDGDTLELKMKDFKTRIRLIGIDTPELGQKPYGDRAGAFMRKLINESSIREVCCKKGEEPLDKYGRTLAYCWSGDTFLNAEMIKAGQAVTFFIGDKNIEYKKIFFDLEEMAEDQGLGIHNPEEPLPELPSEWRRNNKRR